MLAREKAFLAVFFHTHFSDSAKISVFQLTSVNENAMQIMKQIVTVKTRRF